MCREVVFAGTCTRCGESQTWRDLTQELSCLEAKNNCGFGQCSNGVYEERHDFDQECDRCAEEDEGIGDLDEALEEEEQVQNAASGKRAVRDAEEEREAKKQKL